MDILEDTQPYSTRKSQARVNRVKINYTCNGKTYYRNLRPERPKKDYYKTSLSTMYSECGCCGRQDYIYLTIKDCKGCGKEHQFTLEG